MITYKNFPDLLFVYLRRSHYTCITLILMLGFTACKKDKSSSSAIVLMTNEVSNVNGDSAVAGGNITADGGSAILERGVCYDTIHSPDLTGFHTNNGTGKGMFSCTINKLRPNTLYYVRAYARNSVDTCYGNEVTFNSSSKVFDFDGNVYSIVTIGHQYWMKENLHTTHFRNGDSLPVNVVDSVWQTTYTGTAAIYNNDSINLAVYGRLYNWYAVADPRGLCPSGWHVPSDGDWNKLAIYLDPQTDTTLTGSESQIAGGMLKEASLDFWFSPNTGATNSSGFSALPGGYRSYLGAYYLLGPYGYWWSSTQSSTNNAWYRTLNYNNANVYRDFDLKRNGFSVRCIHD